MGGGAQSVPGTQNVVFSRTLKPADYPDVVMSDDAVAFVTLLREKPGKDIAVFGGGELFRSLLRAGLVDRLEIGVMPVLLGGGIPLLPPPAERAALRLRKQRLYQKTGTVSLEYDIVRPA
jgi:dihydrofolate reductase